MFRIWVTRIVWNVPMSQMHRGTLCHCQMHTEFTSIQPGFKTSAQRPGRGHSIHFWNASTYSRQGPLQTCDIVSFTHWWGIWGRQKFHQLWPPKYLLVLFPCALGHGEGGEWRKDKVELTVLPLLQQTTSYYAGSGNVCLCPGTYLGLKTSKNHQHTERKGHVWTGAQEPASFLCTFKVWTMLILSFALSNFKYRIYFFMKKIFNTFKTPNLNWLFNTDC